MGLHPWQKTCFAFLCFAVFNLGLNEFNPWALKAGQFPGFAFPALYGMFHMLFSCVAALIIMRCVQKPEAGYPSFAQLYQYLDGLATIGLCNALNVVLNNLSLTLVSLFVNQVIKSSSPMPTIVFEHLLTGKRFSIAVITSVVCICVGAVLAPWFKVSQVNQSGGEASSVLGILSVIVAMLASSLKPVVAMVMMSGTKDRPKLEPTVILFYDCALSFCFMFVYWIVSYERYDSIQYLVNAPVNAPYLEGYNTSLIGLGIIFAGSMMAFSFNLSTYYYVMLASALGSMIGSIGLKVLVICVAAVQAGVSDPITIFGIAIVAVSICAYAGFAYRDSCLAEEAAAASGAEAKGSGGPEGAKASEATPLKG